MRKLTFQRLIPALALALGLVLAPGGAQAALTKQASILETLKAGSAGTQFMLDQVGAANEAPKRMSSGDNVKATGFTWGAYEPSTIVSGTNISSCKVLDYGNDVGIFLMYNWAAGQYYYTLFATDGSKTTDQYVDLSGQYATIGWEAWQGGAVATQVKIRWIIRTNNGTQWYVSNAVDMPNPIPQTATPVTSQVSGLTWYAVNSSVNTNLNALAGGDETALTFATTPSTPDLSKVDGGGFFMEAGNDAYTTSFKPRRLAWSANSPVLKAIGKPSYTTLPASVVLGPGASTGQLALINGNPGAITITNLQLISPDNQISLVSPPAMPQSASATSTVTLTLNYLGTAADTTSATLYVTCNQDNTPGTIVKIPIVGRVLKNASVYESFVNPSSSNMARYRPNNNQNPVTMNCPILGSTGGTGFKWGAYTNATLVGNSRDMVGINGNRLTFYGGLTDDAHTGGNYKGCYAYTIFDSLGGTAPDYNIKLEKVQFAPDNAATGQQIRFLLRDASGFWYISNNVINVVATGNPPSLVTYDLDGYAWKRVDAAAETYMNTLGTVPQVGIADPATLTAAPSFSLNGITGGGIYVETGEMTETQQTPLTMWDLNYIIRASNNDRMAIKTKNPTTSNTAIVPFKRVGLMAINCQMTSGNEVAMDGLDVTVSSATGLKTMFLYSDPNANGIPDDGAALTSCTVTGTNAKLTFKTPEVVVKGTPKDYALVGVFDDTASSKTMTFTVAGAKWRQNTSFGGTGDVITQTPDPATATVKVSPVALPDILTNPQFTQFTETWEKVALGLLATSPASGPVANADCVWTYNFTGGSAVKMPAQFVKNNGTSVAGGVETKDLTSEVSPFDAGFYFRNDLQFALQFDSRYIQMMKLDFTAVITSTTLSTLQPHFSARQNLDFSNFGIRLNPSSGSSYQVTFWPQTDFDRSFFSVSAGGLSEYAPGNILAYANNNGLGRYQCSVWFAPTFNAANLTTVKVDIKHLESGKTATWMTQVNGSIPNVRSVDLWFSPWANAFFDDISLTAYQYFVNPVKSWSMFE